MMTSAKVADDPLPDPDDAFDTPSISELIGNGIESFFRKIVEDALNPLLDLLGRTLLTTPMPEELPRAGELWEQSRQFSVAASVLLVMIAGIIVMGYETVQFRHSLKEIAPRIVIAFLGANLSLLLTTKAIVFANAASASALGSGLDPDIAAEALSDLLLGSLLNRGAFLVVIGLGAAVMLIVLLILYVVRVALTLILVVAAPLAIICYALPQTEGVARWWCRAFAGVLAIQLGQSLTLIVFLRVFFDGDNFTIFGGATADGLINLLVCMALFYVLIKIPFWIGAQVRSGSSRSFVGGLVRGMIAYKAFGLLRGTGRATPRSGRRSGGGPGASGRSGRRPGPTPRGPRGHGGTGRPAPGPKPDKGPPCADAAARRPPRPATRTRVTSRSLPVDTAVPSSHEQHSHDQRPTVDVTPGRRPHHRSARPHPRDQAAFAASADAASSDRHRAVGSARRRPHAPGRVVGAGRSVAAPRVSRLRLGGAASLHRPRTPSAPLSPGAGTATPGTPAGRHPRTPISSSGAQVHSSRSRRPARDGPDAPRSDSPTRSPRTYRGRTR